VPKELGDLKALTILNLAGNPDLALLPEHGGICTIII